MLAEESKHVCLNEIASTRAVGARPIMCHIERVLPVVPADHTGGHYAEAIST